MKMTATAEMLSIFYLSLVKIMKVMEDLYFFQGFFS